MFQVQMHHSTAIHILRDIARQNLLSIKGKTFVYGPYPQPVHARDVKEAFMVILERFKTGKSRYRSVLGTGYEFWCMDEALFEKLFEIIYAKQKVFPRVGGSDNLEGAPLPTLFIGAEKTQVRQIPLTEVPPWPFRFLLELGGMVVCRPRNKRDFLLELRQYLNNHPQYRVKVHAEEWPDGEILVVTTWFEVVPKIERKSNINVPN